MSNRRTNQRSAIVRVIRDAPGPLRPLEILDLASPIVPTLGNATVYRRRGVRHPRMREGYCEASAAGFRTRRVRDHALRTMPRLQRGEVKPA